MSVADPGVWLKHGRKVLGLPVRPTALEVVAVVFQIPVQLLVKSYEFKSFHELRICLVVPCGLHQRTIRKIFSFTFSLPEHHG